MQIQEKVSEKAIAYMKYRSRGYKILQGNKTWKLAQWQSYFILQTITGNWYLEVLLACREQGNIRVTRFRSGMLDTSSKLPTGELIHKHQLERMSVEVYRVSPNKLTLIITNIKNGGWSLFDVEGEEIGYVSASL